MLKKLRALSQSLVPSKTDSQPQSLVSLRLVRVRNSKEIPEQQGTPGLLITPFGNFDTLELPWRNNINKLSCIPLGKYVCNWTYSNAFGRNMYAVNAVPGRSGVRIHSGNFAGDVTLGYRSHVLGCILLGQGYAKIGNQVGLTNSKAAVSRFQTKMAGKSFVLEITEVTED